MITELLIALALPILVVVGVYAVAILAAIFGSEEQSRNAKDVLPQLTKVIELLVPRLRNRR